MSNNTPEKPSYSHHYKIGDIVEYSPSPGHWFLGQVSSKERLVGTTSVVELDRMEAGYAAFTRKPAGTSIMTGPGTT